MIWNLDCLDLSRAVRGVPAEVRAAEGHSGRARQSNGAPRGPERAHAARRAQGGERRRGARAAAHQLHLVCGAARRPRAPPPQAGCPARARAPRLPPGRAAHWEPSCAPTAGALAAPRAHCRAPATQPTRLPTAHRRPPGFRTCC